MPTIRETIEEQAAEPSSASGDGHSSTNRPLAELHAEEDRQAAQAAVAGPNSSGGRKGFNALVRRGKIVRTD